MSETNATGQLSLGRSLGRTMNEFRKASNELRSTLEDEIRVEEQKAQRAAGPCGPA